MVANGNISLSSTKVSFTDNNSQSVTFSGNTGDVSVYSNDNSICSVNISGNTILFNKVNKGDTTVEVNVSGTDNNRELSKLIFVNSRESVTNVNPSGTTYLIKNEESVNGNLITLSAVSDGEVIASPSGTDTMFTDPNNPNYIKKIILGYSALNYMKTKNNLSNNDYLNFNIYICLGDVPAGTEITIEFTTNNSLNIGSFQNFMMGIGFDNTTLAGNTVIDTIKWENSTWKDNSQSSIYENTVSINNNGSEYMIKMNNINDSQKYAVITIFGSIKASDIASAGSLNFKFSNIYYEI